MRRLGIAAGLAGAIALGLMVFACGSGERTEKTGTQSGGSPPAPAPAKEAAQPAASGGDAAAARAKADQIFATRCFTCHGKDGAGDGPASAGLSPPPRNFHDAAWQASVTDDHIAKIISFGGAAVGKSPGMPGNPDLISQPDVVAALVAHVRSLRTP